VKTEKPMKTLMQMLSIFLLAFCGNALAQNDISGTWEGRLEIAPGQEMNVRFIISKKDDGTYKAVLDSPDAGGIKNEPASSVKYAGSQLTVEVDSLSGSFSGTVGKDTITGEWKQPGGALPLVLTSDRKPSPSAYNALLGEWHGKLKIPGGPTNTQVVRFSMDKNGRISGSRQVVEQNAQGLPVNNLLFKDNQVSFLFAGLDYKGRLSGDTITGTAKLNALEIELNLTRGKYVEPGIDMPAEDIKRLEGRWVGRVKTSTGVMVNTVWTFKRNDAGQLKATIMSPERNSTVRLIDVVLNGDRLSYRLQRVDKTFSGKVNKSTITGFNTFRGKDTEVTVTRGAKIEPIAPVIDIPDETMKKLLGRWRGSIGTTQLIFRFERDAKGKKVIYFNLPQRRAESSLVLEASITEGKLSLKIPDSEYNGSLGENKIDGIFKDGEQSYPLVLTKEIHRPQ